MPHANSRSVEPDKRPEPPHEDHQRGSEASALVLVVDDEDANRYAITRILRPAGYEVIEASSGRDGLALARTRKPALVVLDIGLPDITGWDVCRALKLDPATATTPILQVSSTYVTDDDRAYGLNEGADSYLVHPVEPVVLLATVKALLRLGETQAALRRSEERLRTLLDNAPVVLFAVDAAGVYKLFTGNRLDRLNLSPDAVVGRSIYVVHAGDQRFLANAARALAGEHLVDELALYGRWFEIRYNPIYDAAARPDGFIAVATDITDRRKAELARQDVLAVVAHDLRSPIAAIQLNIALLERMQSGAAPVPAPVQEVLKAMGRSVTRAAQLIADLLDHARIEAGTFTVTRAAQELAPLLREALDLMLPIARAKGVRIALEIAGPAAIDGDGGRLLQALCNLIENAIKFAPAADGVVTVRALDRPTEVAIEVEDNGPGIAADDFPRLFNRFSQGAANRKPGTGLGLSIAEGIVQAHGGRIWAENRTGSGARFCIALSKRTAEVGRGT